MQKNAPLYQKYGPKALLLGSKEFDCTETSRQIIQAYADLSTESKSASWEEVAKKLDMSIDRNTQRKIVGTLNLAAGAYRDLYNQPQPYIVREPNSPEES